MPVLGLPGKDEAAPYYSTYIDWVKEPDVNAYLAQQLNVATEFFSRISEQQSLHRYAPDKWSMREALNHINDTERIFAWRALWFARGLPSPLPSFDQEIAARAAHADAVPWNVQVEEFRNIRLSTISLFKNMPDDAWMKSGIASEKKFTVRALAFIIAGHVDHHINVLRTRYL
jgi:DinB superfamily